ncbi:ABC transporter substrate-binding protein [Actinomadura rugatobispora]|uniref:ABC transporter substrate-binding protein n=1 Tax=Actinomadura rugatobispora TaxID=1994 RepID=A0ABW1AET6_9ACTN|nr:ABC transporter substrate-binding protein [Actinomadura rugatobispora]
MRNRRQALTAALGASVLALAAAACGTGPAGATDGASGGVTLRVGDQTGITQSRLEAAGLLDDLPYKIQWSRFPAALHLHEALRAGAVDIGGAADSPTVAAIAGGSKIKAVAAWSNGGTGTYILVPKDSPVRSVADLRGKRVSPSTKGSVAHYLLLGALKQAGVGAHEVQLNYLAPADASAAFSTGRLDAWVTWGVFAARTRGQLGARVLLDGRGINAGLYVLSATDTALGDGRKVKAMADFAERVDKGYAWGRQNPGPFTRWFAEFAGQPESVAAQVQPEEAKYRRLAMDDAFAGQLQRTHDTWVTAGVVSGRRDLGPYVYRNLAAAP